MKKKISKIISTILMIFFIALFIFSSIKILNWKKNNDKNRKINETLHEYIRVGGNEKYNIDFDKLESKNEDTVAYIRVFGTKIDYVVVRGSDNEYYLNHDYNKGNNQSGWIFADMSNRFDGTDKNIVIYGHNTIDGSMFGSLKNVLSSSWRDEYKDKDIILVTKNGMQRYKVFSTYKIENEEYYIQTYFESENSYKEFLTNVKARSNYKYDVDLSNAERILTLSTCANNGKNRVVLHAVRIVEEQNEQ